MAALRIVLGIVIGIAVGIGLVMVGDAINHRLWPPPPDVQVTNPEAIRAYMATAPFTSLLGLPVTWTISAFAGAFVGAKIGARTWAGWVAGGALFAATCANLIMIPHPLWMLVSALIFVPLAAWFGAKLGRHEVGRSEVFENSYGALADKNLEALAPAPHKAEG